MASGARDLIFNFLSKTDRFDLAQPARDLEDVADAARDAVDPLRDLEDVDGSGVRELGDDAKDTARELEDLGRVDVDGLRDLDRDAERAGDGIDQLGDDAKGAADRVDAAMDAIASSSKRAAGKLDDAGDQGKRSLREMGDEGQDTAREMAASFDGTADGIKDAMQEAATNVLATLGPIGAAVGVGAGMAIGWIRSQAEAAREEIRDLTSTIIDSGGKLSQANVLDKLRQFAEDGTITDLADQARRAKIDVNDYLRAMAGDPDALERSRSAIEKVGEANRTTTQSYGRMSKEQAALTYALETVNQGLDGTASKFALAQQAVDAYQGSSDQVGESVAAMGDALEDFVGPADVYGQLLADKNEKEREAAQATADATKSQTDSWQDFVKEGHVSVGEWITEMETMVSAQEEWAANMASLAERGVSDGVLEQLARMGPEGAPLVADLVKASDSEISRLNGVFARQAGTSTDALAAGLRAGKPKARSASAELREDVRATLQARTIGIPTKVDTPALGPVLAAVAAIQRAVPAVVVPVVTKRSMREVP